MVTPARAPGLETAAVAQRLRATVEPGQPLHDTPRPRTPQR